MIERTCDKCSLGMLHAAIWRGDEITYKLSHFVVHWACFTRQFGVTM